MNEIIQKLKEIILIKNEYCTHKCNDGCPLKSVIKEIWYDNDYSEIDICDAIDLIENVLK